MKLGLFFIICFAVIIIVWFAAMILFILDKDNKDFEDSEVWKDEDEDKF